MRRNLLYTVCWECWVVEMFVSSSSRDAKYLNEIENTISLVLEAVEWDSDNEMD